MNFIAAFARGVVIGPVLIVALLLVLWKPWLMLAIMALFVLCVVGGILWSGLLPVPESREAIRRAEAEELDRAVLAELRRGYRDPRTVARDGGLRGDRQKIWKL